MSSTKAQAITRFQAIFRGRRCREMHVDRVRKGCVSSLSLSFSRSLSLSLSLFSGMAMRLN